jgi:hypothetical protein
LFDGRLKDRGMGLRMSWWVKSKRREEWSGSLAGLKGVLFCGLTERALDQKHEEGRNVDNGRK